MVCQRTTAASRTATLTQAAHDLDDLADTGYAVVRDLLATRGSLSNGDVQTALGLDAATARDLLRRLVVDGVAKTEGERRGMRYVWVGE